MNTNIRKNTQYGREVIDLLELFRFIFRRWYLIIVSICLGGALGLTYCSLFVEPVYSSTAQIYLRGTNNHISLESLTLSTRLATDYEVIFKSRPNIQSIINNLGLEQSIGTVQNSVSISNIEGSHILTITATSNSPKTARDIANGVMEQGMEKVREIDSQEPYVVERAIENSNRINNGEKDYINLGAGIGVLFMIVILASFFIMNDHIQTREDVENYIGIPVLSTVLEDNSMTKYINKKMK